jgi:cysteine desulfurase
MKLPVYLDYAATTPVDDRVAAAMMSCLGETGSFANPSSTHEPGTRARALVEQAREQVADIINASSEEVIWTSGATESDNLAILGAARFRRTRGEHVVTTFTEHPAVLQSCRQLEREGYRVTYLRPDEQGIVEPASVAAVLTDDTVLVSVMHVNNETGVVQDIGAIGKICRDHDVLFHVDAAQSVGRLPVDVRALHIDLLSMSGHKIYGPKGVGALFLDRERIHRVEPLFYGGGHERGLRPGTLATHQVVGMGAAVALAAECMIEDVAALEALRLRLWSRICSVPGTILNGDPVRRASHILSVSVSGVEGESLHDGLRRELAVASGSACASDSDEASRVLHALGHSDQLAQSTVRFSLGRGTSELDIDFAADCFARTVERLRRLAPAGSGPHDDRCEGGIYGEAGHEDLGAHVVFNARLDGPRIAEISFKAYGCPDTLAACAMAAEQLEDQSVTAMLELEPRAIAEALDIPVEKMGRLLIVQDALRKCFTDWDNRRSSG